MSKIINGATAHENWLTFIRDRRWSRRQKHRLLDQFGSPKVINELTHEEIRAHVGRFQSTTAKISRSALQRDLQWLQQPSNSLITIGSEHYPSALKEIVDPPLALFARGDLGLLAYPKISIVGSRRPTPIGAKIADSLATQISQLGIVVTSGMALGVDAISHKAALNCEQPTIAIMGCGLDLIYPLRHRDLFERIAESGLLLSEYPLGVPPSKHHFPERNRIVSGLSVGVLIVEAADRSGTLITARLATEQDREVMVVPGSSLSKQYQGSHRLLQQGAALVTSIDDILFTVSNQLSSITGLSQHMGTQDDESSVCTEVLASQKLLRCIGYESTSADSMISESGLTAAEVSAMLITLELQGMIAVADDGGYFNLS